MLLKYTCILCAVFSKEKPNNFIKSRSKYILYVLILLDNLKEKLQYLQYICKYCSFPQ